MTETHPTAPVARSRPRWLLPVIAAGVLAALLVAAWLLLAGRSIDVRGDVTVNDPGGIRVAGNACESDGYADVRAGTQVVVTDAAGDVVAMATLGPGSNAARPGGGWCTFPFTADVPAGSDFYGVEVASRGVVRLTADQLAAGVHLTIGG